MVFVGIDLGTNNSCIGVILKNDEVVIIKNDKGERTTPSYLSITSAGIKVGREAKEAQPDNIKDTFYGIKRLIGRSFDHPIVTQERKNLPFTIVNHKERPYINVNLPNQHCDVPCEVFCALLLKRLKADAETYLREHDEHGEHRVTGAVITVPANFTHTQRVSIQTAAELAGLQLLGIINEPTAAAIAYKLNKMEEEGTKYVLVFDLGGGTFDVSVLEVRTSPGSERKCIVNVKGTDGISHLGGEDFDMSLVNHIKERLVKQGVEETAISSSIFGMLRSKCEAAKIELSLKTETLIACIVCGKEYSFEVTRAEFESLCNIFFERIMDLVRKVLTQSNKKKEDIQEVVLIGGSSRTPKLQELLTEFFQKDVSITIDPDVAVAQGATIEAASKRKNMCKSVVLKDVTSLSFGIEAEKSRNGEIYVDQIIPKGTKLPARFEKPYTTSFHGQPSVSVKVYQGEDIDPKKENFLGKFTISNLSQFIKPTIKVTMEVGNNCILKVSAVCENSEEKRSIAINTSNCLTEDDIKIMKSLVHKIESVALENVSQETSTQLGETVETTTGEVID